MPVFNLSMKYIVETVFFVPAISRSLDHIFFGKIGLNVTAHACRMQYSNRLLKTTVKQITITDHNLTNIELHILIGLLILHLNVQFNISYVYYLIFRKCGADVPAFDLKK